MLVGSHNNTASFEEAEILQFNEYKTRLYYFLTDDETGHEYDTVATYDTLGDVLYSKRNIEKINL